MKAQWSHPSSAITSHSSARIHSLWVCCKTQELVMQCTSASLILFVQCNFASLTAVAWCTLAYLILAVWHNLASLTSAACLTSASLIASVVWASFMHTMILALSSSSLWWESIVALVVSSHSRAMFICPCNWSTSSGSLAGSTLREAWSCGIGKVLAASGIFWHSWWGWWVTEVSNTGYIFWHDHPQRCLSRACHWGRDGWILHIQSGGPSVTSFVVRAPKATDEGSLFGVLCRRQEWRQWVKPAAATSRPPGAAG